MPHTPQAMKLVEQLWSSLPPANPPLLDTQKEFFSSRLIVLWESLFIPPPADTLSELIHELPQSVESEVRGVLRKSRGQVASELRGLLEQQRVSNQLRALDTEINRIPIGDPDEDLFQEIANVKSKHWSARRKMNGAGRTGSKNLGIDVTTCTKRLTEISALRQTADNARSKLDLLGKIRLVIQNMSTELHAAKASTLQKTLER